LLRVQDQVQDPKVILQPFFINLINLNI
jgi:hypothetical protein